MILDTGICCVYSITNDSAPGDMPTQKLTLKYQSWYKELSFETAPIYVTEAQEDVEITSRIRIHQNKNISNHDVVILNEQQYEVARAYHGIDKDNGQPITDLSLRKVVQEYGFAE